MLSCIHRWTVKESQYKDCEHEFGESNDNLFAILSIFHVLYCIWISGIIPTCSGMFVLYVDTFFPKWRIFLPVWYWGSNSFLDCSASCWAYYWVGPIHCPPKSNLTPFRSTVNVLPPTRSIAYRTTTYKFGCFFRRSSAAVSPDSPPPITKILSLFFIWL